MVAGAAVEIAPASLQRSAVPLLMKQCHVTILALVADGPDPNPGHRRASSGSEFEPGVAVVDDRLTVMVGNDKDRCTERW